jgi:hypothetical protein
MKEAPHEKTTGRLYPAPTFVAYEVVMEDRQDRVH